MRNSIKIDTNSKTRWVIYNLDTKQEWIEFNSNDSVENDLKVIIDLAQKYDISQIDNENINDALKWFADEFNKVDFKDSLIRIEFLTNDEIRYYYDILDNKNFLVFVKNKEYRITRNQVYWLITILISQYGLNEKNFYLNV